MAYYVYIMSNDDTSKFSVGVTNNLPRKILDHKNNKTGHAAENNLRKLVYFEKHDQLQEANRREKETKSWDRPYMKQIISFQNPHFEDLFNKVF